jgi:hypothetical protein
MASEHSPEHVLERHILCLEGLAATLQSGEVEQIADDVLDALSFVAKDGKIPLAGCSIQRFCMEREGLEVAADRCERSHQLV